jgi:hypothetical protein
MHERSINCRKSPSGLFFLSACAMKNYKMSVVYGLITFALLVCSVVCVVNNDYDTFFITCFPLTLSLAMFLFVCKIERDIHKSMDMLKESWLYELKEKGQ